MAYNLLIHKEFFGSNRGLSSNLHAMPRYASWWSEYLPTLPRSPDRATGLRLVGDICCMNSWDILYTPWHPNSPCEDTNKNYPNNQISGGMTGRLGYQQRNCQTKPTALCLRLSARSRSNLPHSSPHLASCHLIKTKKNIINIHHRQPHNTALIRGVYLYPSFQASSTGFFSASGAPFLGVLVSRTWNSSNKYSMKAWRFIDL